MDFELTDDQRAFRDSLSRFLQDRYTYAHRHRVARGQSDAQTWPALAELGIPAMLVPASAGGLGRSAEDLLVVCEALGPALVLEPVLTSCVMATVALARAVGPAQAHALLGQMASGDAKVCWVHDDIAHDLAAPGNLVAQGLADGSWRISGCVAPIGYGMVAEAFIVPAVMSHDGSAAAAPALFLVTAAQAGLSRTPCTLVDDTPAARMSLDGCSALKLELCARSSAREAALWGEFASCAESVGIMERALALSIAQLSQRRQFGQALADYQSLRHKVAEMAADLEICRALAIGACVAVSGLTSAQGDAVAEASLRVGQARQVTSRLALRVCETALQLHGGIGMTTEHPVGTLLRRVACLNHLFGQSREHAQRLAGAALANRANS